MGPLDSFADKKKSQNAISPLKDPFKVDRIKQIMIVIDNEPLFGLQPYVRCSVKFSNGNTRGEQDFKGTELKALMVEVQAFIDSLKDKK